ncbi:hypothetical protein Micbo1qcDRAFT_215920 [Microdochium bolleyi]|uniref:Uncharacterized protein n=1 Tax=Microdochium bolleyi TaxID=196109 RepID=A0A136IRE1_9PEZI|nr:hypothetical protein Micbo1qcDRAFT_215920 [Microdochium bolleyi]
MEGPAAQLRQQWLNPRDILSLLLLVGSDIVQKAIAQLIGYQLRLPLARSGPGLSIAPVAFSFGWVAYGFTNLLAAVGNMSLMPRNEHPSILVNCSNGFARENHSWLLGRFLRDHELTHAIERGQELSNEDSSNPQISLRIDVFHLEPNRQVECDYVWWCGWLTLAAQLVIAALPWILYGDWSTMLVTLCGTLLALATCSLPQWEQEKWGGRMLKSDKVTCLTRGNGSAHIVVFLGRAGSWDLESAVSAAGSTKPRSKTRLASLVLPFLWTFLLISVSGIEENTWFLIGIGGLGMLQNVLAAGAPRTPAASGFHLRRFERASVIMGRRESYVDDPSDLVDLQRTDAELAELSAWASQSRNPRSRDSLKCNGRDMAAMPAWLRTMSKEDGVPPWLEALKPGLPNEDIIYAVGVHGALMELEKWVPTAGVAMQQIFFPGGFEYKEASIRDNAHRKFWKQAHHTIAVRKLAENRRRAGEALGNADVC